ncbi:MAG: hypothetical protein ACOY35_07325 [Bacillota bacterium]
MSILASIKCGDCVDFGEHGYGYILGENEEGTAYYVTIEESDRSNPHAKGWYISKKYAEWVIEEY